jgi:polyhydroxybutyrate depolymerase
MFKKSWLVLVWLVGAVVLSACGSSPAISTAPNTAAAGSSGAIAATASNATGQKPGKYQQSIEFEGRTRSYLLYLPPAVTGPKALPLLLAFHGGGGQGQSMQRLTGFNTLADQQGFIAVYPDAVDKNWNDGRDSPFLASQREGINDTGFVSALIDHLSHNLNIDPKRIYATGMSNGGIFSQMVGCELAGKIAAIAPVAGSMATKLAPNCNPARPLPVMMIMGTDDPLVPWQGGAVVNDKRGTVLSVADTIQKWVAFDGCDSTPTITREPDKDPQDGTQVRREAYSSCKDSTEVILYAVEGGGHAWPGGPQYAPPPLIGKTNRDINASQLIWDFFSRHPMA